MAFDANFVAVVQKLSQEQGAAAFIDARRFKSLLADYTAGEYKKERRRLEMVLDAGYAKLIAEADDVAAAKAAVIRRLQDDDGLSTEAAGEMADLLALAIRGEEAVKTGAVCTKCGKPLQPEWKACPYCGAACGQASASDSTPSRGRKEADEATYIISVNMQESGPYTLRQLVEMAFAGEITREYYACKTGSKAWQPVSEIPEVEAAIYIVTSGLVSSGIGGYGIDLIDPGFMIKDGVLLRYYGREIEVVIPDSVTAIGNRAFDGCTSLTSVNIPDSVTAIGNRAFDGCASLARVTIPNSVTSIGLSAFAYCTSLASVAIPDGVKTIGDWAFHNCPSLTSVNIPNSVTAIGDKAFRGCTNLASVSIPNSVTSIRYGAFSGCTSLPQDIRKRYDDDYDDFDSDEDDDTDFDDNNDGTEFVIDDDGVLMNYNGAGGDVVIPDGVTSIGSLAFDRCRELTSVTIPDSVKTIENSAFRDCDCLASVTIPKKVTTIEEEAFFNCRNLAKVVFAKGSNIRNFGKAVSGIEDSIFTWAGNGLRKAYLASSPHAGTYIRTGKDKWTKTKEA